MSEGPRIATIRPICPGARILNPNCGTPGTIGIFGLDDQGQVWIVSCRHVLLRPASVPDDELPGPEPIHQPAPGAADSLVADSDPTRQSRNLDCAAARVRAGVAFDSSILGLRGPAAPAVPPMPRMRVIKSGAQTCITSGVIQSINGNTIRIGLWDGAPAGSALSAGGDSGAVWLEEDTLAPVGLHRRGNSNGVEFALATPMTAVMSALQLQIAVGGPVVI